MRDMLLSDPHRDNPLVLFGRAALTLALLWLWFSFLTHSVHSNYAGRSFLHYVHLPFHEAGHIIFGMLGRFIGVLGGSLMQVLVPLVCLGTFLLQTRDAYAASVALWWGGQSLVDLAPYINDASALRLTLLGGVTGRDVQDYHDWEFILKRLGMLDYDHALAALAQWGGLFVMLAAMLWAAVLMYYQARESFGQ